MRKVWTSAGRLVRKLTSDRRGVTALEYSLIAALMVGAITVGGLSMSSAISNKFTAIGTCLTNGTGAGCGTTNTSTPGP